MSAACASCYSAGKLGREVIQAPGDNGLLIGLRDVDGGANCL